MHLTLRFLGEIDEKTTGKVADGLIGALAIKKPFTISTDEIVLKGNRTLWLGIKANPALDALKDAIDEELLSLGIKKDKRLFSPHLTLMRIRDRDRARKVRQRLRDIDPKLEIEIRVDRVRFIKSELGFGKTIHSVLREYALKK